MKSALSLTTLNELFIYNYWARDRQLNVCNKLSEEQFNRPLVSSFSSLRDTMVHMISVERVWLDRWLNKTPRPLLNPKEFPNLYSVQKCWCNVEEDMKVFLSSLSEEDLDKIITCTSTRGQTWSYPLWRMMVHLLNHQSYHRGQVTTLLRQLQVQPAKVDFLDAHDVDFKL